MLDGRTRRPRLRMPHEDGQRRAASMAIARRRAAPNSLSRGHSRAGDTMGRSDPIRLRPASRCVCGLCPIHAETAPAECRSRERFCAVLLAVTAGVAASTPKARTRLARFWLMVVNDLAPPATTSRWSSPAWQPSASGPAAIGLLRAPVLVGGLLDELAKSTATAATRRRTRRIVFALAAVLATITIFGTLIAQSIRVWINERTARTAEANLVTGLINTAVEGLGAEKTVSRVGRPVTLTPRAIGEHREPGHPHHRRVAGSKSRRGDDCNRGPGRLDRPSKPRSPISRCASARS